MEPPAWDQVLLKETAESPLRSSLRCGHGEMCLGAEERPRKKGQMLIKRSLRGQGRREQLEGSGGRAGSFILEMQHRQEDLGMHCWPGHGHGNWE